MYCNSSEYFMLNLLCNLTWKGVLLLCLTLLCFVQLMHNVNIFDCRKGRKKKDKQSVRESLILKEQRNTTIINDNNFAHNGHSKWQRLFYSQFHRNK